MSTTGWIISGAYIIVGFIVYYFTYMFLHVDDGKDDFIEDIDCIMYAILWPFVLALGVLFGIFYLVYTVFDIIIFRPLKKSAKKNREKIVKKFFNNKNDEKINDYDLDEYEDYDVEDCDEDKEKMGDNT